MLRRAPLRRRRATPRRSERVLDADYLARVRELPCCARTLGDMFGCRGRIEVDHAGRKPAGRKCSDDETVPMCSLHHSERHTFIGLFGGWSRAQMRAWLDEQIAATRAHLTAAPAARSL